MAHDLGTVLDAARILRDERPDIRFAIVGDGAERQIMMDRSAAEGLTNLKFTGLVPREDIPNYLAASDISLVTLKCSDVFKSVLPSKMFESMAAARPILLAVEGEAQQMLERGGAGLPVPPGDAAALAAAVRRLADDPELRRKMGSAGLRFVEQQFSRRAWAHRYLRVFERSTRPVAVTAVRQPDATPEL
jgi:glycosyltransferase involved in cell wall biosynthesis